MKLPAKLFALLREHRNKVRKADEGNWLWINNKFIYGGYMAMFDNSATLILAVLALHASEPDQHCYPNEDLIMLETGIKDRATITKHLKNLEGHRIIAVSRATKKPNHYLLLHPDLWREAGNPVPESSTPDMYDSTDSTCKDEPHTNKTLNKNQLITEEDSNAKYRSMLAHAFDEQDIDRAIAYLEKHEQKPAYGAIKGLLRRWAEENKIVQKAPLRY